MGYTFTCNSYAHDFCRRNIKVCVSSLSQIRLCLKASSQVREALLSRLLALVKPFQMVQILPRYYLLEQLL